MAEQNNAERRILERPDDQHTIRIVGNVYTNVSDDDFLDEFIGWLESKGWSFFGHTVELTEDDDDEEIFEKIVGDTESK